MILVLNLNQISLSVQKSQANRNELFEEEIMAVSLSVQKSQANRNC